MIQYAMKRNRPLNEEKRHAILNAAIDEFYDNGYDLTNMDIISKKANVSKATVYKHFNNKEELFFAIVFIIQEKINEIFEFQYEKEVDIKIQLLAIAKKEMDFVSSQKHLRLMKILSFTMFIKNSLSQKVKATVENKNLINVQKWFESARENGQLEFEDASYVSRQFIGNLKAFSFFPQLYGMPILSLEEQKVIIEKSVEMVLQLYTPSKK